jgi:hypothetical protein
MFRMFRRRGRSPLDRPCSDCGASSRFGYGEHPETKLEALRPVCVDCLKRLLIADYGRFANRAVVVQPAPGPPVYVFQSAVAWQARFRDSEMAKDVQALLDDMGRECDDCRETAKFLWIESLGLTADTFEQVLARGVRATLLQNNPAPVSLCGHCCVERISGDLTARNLSYLEVCAPVGPEPGFVLPMGY